MINLQCRLAIVGACNIVCITLIQQNINADGISTPRWCDRDRWRQFRLDRTTRTGTGARWLIIDIGQCFSLPTHSHGNWCGYADTYTSMYVRSTSISACICICTEVNCAPGLITQCNQVAIYMYNCCMQSGCTGKRWMWNDTACYNPHQYRLMHMHEHEHMCGIRHATPLLRNSWTEWCETTGMMSSHDINNNNNTRHTKTRQTNKIRTKRNKTTEHKTRSTAAWRCCGY